MKTSPANAYNRKSLYLNNSRIYKTITKPKQYIQKEYNSFEHIQTEIKQLDYKSKLIVVKFIEHSIGRTLSDAEVENLIKYI